MLKATRIEPAVASATVSAVTVTSTRRKYYVEYGVSTQAKLIKLKTSPTKVF